MTLTNIVKIVCSCARAPRSRTNHPKNREGLPQPNPNKRPDLINILVVGTYMAGKTCIKNWWYMGRRAHTDMTTIGIDWAEKRDVAIPGSQIPMTVRVWDTAGLRPDRKFWKITSSCFRGAHAIIVVYDRTNQASFDNDMPFIFQELKNRGVRHTVPVAIACNLPRSCNSPATDRKAEALGLLSQQNIGEPTPSAAAVCKQFHALVTDPESEPQLPTKEGGSKLFQLPWEQLCEIMSYLVEPPSLFFETNTMTGHGVQELFGMVINRVVRQRCLQ